MQGENSWFGAGFLGSDPELRTVGQTVVCNMSMGCGWNKKVNGVFEEQVEWIPVSVWGKMGEACAKYLHKGSGVVVRGRFQTRRWVDKNEETHYSSSIVAERVIFMPSKYPDAEPEREPVGVPIQAEPSPRSAHPDASRFGDDDIPF